jgi:hypothetical protein
MLDEHEKELVLDAVFEAQCRAKIKAKLCGVVHGDAFLNAYNELTPIRSDKNSLQGKCS